MNDATFRDDVFAGALALISGGTSGIGAAVGNLLARLGAHVIVTGAAAQAAAAARSATDFTAASAIVLDVRDTRGCVVNTCSVYSFFGGPHAPGYTASKGGVAQLTKALAVAYAVDSVRVNAIAPGWIATPLTEVVRGDPQKSATILARTPLGRWGDPTDVANVVAFLCTPAAVFMTGAIVPVDAGYLVA